MKTQMKEESKPCDYLVEECSQAEGATSTKALKWEQAWHLREKQQEGSSDQKRACKESGK